MIKKFIRKYFVDLLFMSVFVIGGFIGYGYMNSEIGYKLEDKKIQSQVAYNTFDTPQYLSHKNINIRIRVNYLKG